MATKTIEIWPGVEVDIIDNAVKVDVALTVADTVTVVGTAGVGVAAGESDMISPVSLTGLTITGKVKQIYPDLTDAQVIGQAAEIIKLGIDVGFTATTATLAVDLLGYLLDA